MLIFPAIDLKEGRVVRLKKGDFSTVHKVAENYMDTTRSFEAAGASWIHTVDLDGAKEGKPVNGDIFLDIAKNTDLKVEVGGGIRSLETVEYYISRGISRVILGSVALKDPQIVIDSVKEYGEKIAVGIDAKNGIVAAEGWLESSQVNYIDLSLEMVKAGVRNIVFTDISKDGTLSGVNAEQLSALKNAVGDRCNITASGGVHDMEDIRVCKKMGLYGAICGKSIYTGSLDLAEAVRYAGSGD